MCGGAGIPDVSFPAPFRPPHNRRYTHYRPVLRPASELLVRPAGVRAEFGHPDLRYYLLRLKGREEIILEELSGRHSALAVGALDNQGSFERGHYARHISRGVAVS